MSRDIVFDEITHTYLVDGQEVPSVTAILQPLTNRGYANVNPSVLEHARNRGTATHEFLELMDLDAEPEEILPEIIPYIQAYQEWCSIYRPTWEMIEGIVYNELYGYIGTLDRMGVLNGGELAVVDLKTSQPTKEALIAVCLQTRMYELAYLQEHQEAFQRMLPHDTMKRIGLFLRSDGTFRHVDCAEYEKKYNIDCNKVINQLLTLNQTFAALLATGKGKKCDSYVG